MNGHPETVALVLAALEDLDVASRYVFNGDCLYCDGKPVGWISADSVWLKNTGTPVAGTTSFQQGGKGCAKYPPFIAPVAEFGSSEFRVAVQATANALPDSSRRSWWVSSRT